MVDSSAPLLDLMDSVVVTAQHLLTEPLKCGRCLLDFVQGDYAKNLDAFQDALLVYNKKLQHVHVQCGDSVTYD